MGVFLQTAIIPNGNMEEIKKSIQVIAKKQADMNIIPEKCDYSEQGKGIRIILNENSSGYHLFAKELSADIHTDVMLLFIYDDDEWGYYYYDNGKKSDAFSVNPTDENIDDEIDHLTGDVDFVADKFNISVNDIIRYYKEWTDELVENEEVAYEDDRYAYGDCWQMVDFMRKLGFWFEEEKSKAVPKVKTTQNKTMQNNADLSFNEYIRWIKNEFREVLDDALKLESCGRYREAKEVYTKKINALKDKSISDEERGLLTNLYLLRRKCHSITGNKWQMEKDLDAAYELEPENVHILRERCPAGATKKRCERQVADLTTLMRIDSGNYNKYLLDRAWCYYIIEELESARKDMEELIQRGTENDLMDFDALREKLGMED